LAIATARGARAISINSPIALILHSTLVFLSELPGGDWHEEQLHATF
jgi:hypothetical protein